MLDQSKRNSLKMLSGASFIACAPTLVLAAGATEQNGVNDNRVTPETVVPLQGNTELSISISLDSTPTIKLTNHSSQIIELRHVHPGIVHAGEKSYDLNSIFSKQPVTVNAGSSLSFVVESTDATQAETNFPRHLYRKQPQRVVAVKGTDSRGVFINSSRSFYA